MPGEQPQQLGDAVVLRWRPPASRTSNVNRTQSQVSDELSVAQLNQWNGQPRTDAFTSNSNQPPRVPNSRDPWLANPLRTQSTVRHANFEEQVPGSSDPFKNPFGDKAPEAPQNTPPSLPQGNLPPINQAADPLATPESAPAPNLTMPEVKPNPLPSTPDSPKQSDPPEEPSPFDRRSEKDTEDAKDKASTDESDSASELALPNRKKAGTTITCDERRQRVRTPLSSIDLNTSPAFGEGLATAEEREKGRLDFAAGSPVREWADYQGRFLASGRMIDLRNEKVVLDDNGTERCLVLHDLSDADFAYVGRVWNLPLSCGKGYDTYVGRDHIASTVQWKAPGLCHKPLYFEEVELERYGHEVGPVLQPIISSVHFFGNVAVMPYKMGIHPMTECQYSLGYYRPGNCAPYMIPPIPWSLRGAASQAKAVIGGASLIP